MMLSARTKDKRSRYKVRFGYIYSDAHGSHYRPGDIVELSEREADLAKHRIEKVVEKPESEKKQPEKKLESLSRGEYVIK